MVDPQTDHDLLVVINTKLDILVNNVTDHESRLRRLELKLYGLSGVATVLGAGLGVGVSQVIGRG